jgi:hypothetical protein
MSLTSAPIQERRKFVRGELPPRFEVNLLQPRLSVAANGVNFSEGGLCLRLQDTLEVRSLVRLQFTPEGAGSVRSQRPVTCTGRVTWVIQRLDLRDIPPFLFDVGIEFVDPPPMLRQLMVQRGVNLVAQKARPGREKFLTPSVVHGRHYAPCLTRVSNHPRRWHLVVSVDGVPCFSDHYSSERAAMTAWARFRRQQAKR